MSTITYTVISPDMWGHVPGDCIKYGCSRCVRTDAEGDREHDDNTCDCHEWENDRTKVGSIQVDESATDAVIVQTLLDDGFLSEEGARQAKLDDYGSDETDVCDEDGRKLYVLVREEVCDETV